MLQVEEGQYTDTSVSPESRRYSRVDSGVVLQNKQNNQNRFEEYVMLHLDFLYTHAIRLTLSSEKAETLIQQTLSKAFLVFPNFDENTGFHKWIYNILYREFKTGKNSK